jgi:hypothetical protein
MSSDSERLLHQVRDAEDPSPADEARVYAALRAAITAGAAPSVAVDDGLTSTVWSKLLAKLASAKLELWIAALGASALIGGIVYVTARPAQSTARDRAASWRTLPAAEATAHAGQPDIAARPNDNLATSADAQVGSGAHARAEAQLPTDAAVNTEDTVGRRDARAVRSLRTELALLQRVQAALQRGDGAEALRELAAHRTQDRTLLAERRAARILALCLVGRITEARRAAAEFARQHPDAVHREAIARSCANPKRIGPP